MNNPDDTERPKTGQQDDDQGLTLNFAEGSDPAPEGASESNTAGQSDEGGDLSAKVLRSALGRNKTAQLASREDVSGRDLLASVGGVRGMIESALPAVVFLVCYLVSQGDMYISLIPSIAAAVLVLLIRVVTKGDMTGSVAGVFGLALSAALAIGTGNIENNFLLGIITNSALFTVLLLSLIVRRPLLGYLFGSIFEDSTWRHNRRKFRLMAWATAVWVGVAAARLVLQLPLYLSGEVAWLAVVRLVLGLPLYLLALWVTWLLVSAAFRTQRAVL